MFFRVVKVESPQDVLGPSGVEASCNVTGVWVFRLSSTRRITSAEPSWGLGTVSGLLCSRNIKLILASCLIFGFVLGLNLLIVPLYTLVLSDSLLILALIVGMFPLTAVLLSLAGGVLGDYLGRRTIIISGFAFSAGGCLVFSVAKSYYWLLLGQILLGLGDVTFYIATYTLLTELAPPGKQVALQGLSSAALRLGTILGPFVGGYVARSAGFPTAFLVGGALALLGLIIATRIEPVSSPHVHVDSLLTCLVEYHKEAWRFLAENTAVLWANVVHAIALLTWPAMGGSLYLAFLTALGFSSAEAGCLTSAQSLVLSLAQLSSGYLSSRVSITGLSLVAIAIGALTVGMMPWLGSIPLIAVVGCVGGVSGIYMPVLVGFLAENTDRTRRSMPVAWLNLTWAVVSPVALFIFGAIAERVSLSSAFFLSGAFAMFCTGPLWIWAKRKLP